MTPVNTVIDRSHRSHYSDERATRRSRLALFVAGAGLVVAVAGIGAGAFIAGTAVSGHGTQQYDNVVGTNVQAPNSQVVPGSHGQQVDDWPWSSQASPVAN